jgi:hypothetical protein
MSRRSAERIRQEVARGVLNRLGAGELDDPIDDLWQPGDAK